MARRALIVTGAAGTDSTAPDVLNQFDFAAAQDAASVDEALAKLHHDHFDLVIVPLQQTQVAQLQALDRAVRRAGSTFVIGTAPEADPELILRALRSGIHEFQLLPLKPAEFNAAIDRLMVRARPETGQGFVIAVYSGKGGLGATTIAVNLAHALATLNPRGGAAVVDLVAGSGDIRIHLDLKPTYDRGDLLRKIDQMDAQLFRSVLADCGEAMWALPGTDAADLDGGLDGSATSVIIGQLKEDFAFGLLDCDHQLNDGTLAALDAADRVLLVTELAVAALRGTQRTLAVTRRLGYTDEKVCIVVNRYRSGELVTPADAQELLKREIFWKIPNDYRTATGALTKGIPIARYEGHSKLAISYRELALKLSVPDTTASRNGSRLPGRARLGRFFSKSRKRT
jgi:pilus assembly protein CpaE